MNIRLVGAELFHADRRTHRWTDMTKLIRNFAKARKKTSFLDHHSVRGLSCMYVKSPNLKLTVSRENFVTQLFHSRTSQHNFFPHYQQQDR